MFRRVVNSLSAFTFRSWKPLKSRSVIHQPTPVSTMPRTFSTLLHSLDTYMFVGGYTRRMAHATGLGKGISIYKFDTTNGNIQLQKTIPESLCGPNPSALHVNNKANRLYICNEHEEESFITTMQYDPGNNFEIVQQFTDKSFGNDPCVAISDSEHNFLYISNYGANANPSVSIYKIDASGHLTPFAQDIITARGTNAVPSRQEFAHMHYALPCIQQSNPWQFYANDLGRDTMYHYSMNPGNGSLEISSELKFKDGQGPRHITFNPNGVINDRGILYVSLELGSGISTVQFDWITNKLLNVVQTVTTLPDDIVNDAGDMYSASHVLCDKTGRYVYCANRGHDTIVRYVIDKETGLLDEGIGGAWYKCGGVVPRHFEIDPTNNYLIVANQEGAPFDNVSVFKINHDENGALQFVQTVQTGSPSWIQFLQLPKSA